MILTKKTIITLLLLFFAVNHLLADTILLYDGTILSGKVIKKTRDKIIFASSYGTFTIEHKEVIKLYIAKTYKDDINTNIKLGKKMNQAQINKIKKDFIAGEKYKIKEKNEQKKKLKLGNLWNFHRLSFYTAYTNTTLSNYSDSRNINEAMNHGLSFTLSYDYGFEKFIKKRMIFVPGIRIDAGFIIYTDDYSKFNKNIFGLVLIAGPMWILPSYKSKWGYFILACLPGITIMQAEDETDSFMSLINTFTMNLYFGYGYTFGRVNIQCLFKYDFIDDSKVAFHAIGASIGVSYIFL